LAWGTEKLELLNVSENQIESIPDSVANHPNLQLLDIRFNRIEKIPDLENPDLCVYYYADNPGSDQLKDWQPFWVKERKREIEEMKETMADYSMADLISIIRLCTEKLEEKVKLSPENYY